MLQELSYDALGRRVETVRRIDPATGAALGTDVVTRHVCSGLVVLEEYDISSDGAGGNKHDRLRDFMWGDRFPEPIAMIDRTAAGDEAAGVDEPFHYLHDALGSVVALTDDNGVLVERYLYDPYGKTYVEDATPGTIRYWSNYGNPYMWTGQRYDAETRLYHFLFRSYSPELGRWLQRDPLGYVDGVNLQEYAGSSPAVWVDPHGLTPRSFGGNPRTTEPFERFRQQIVPRVKPKPRNLKPQLNPQYYVDPGWGNRFMMGPSWEWMDDDESFEEKQTEFYDWGSSGTPFVNDGRDLYGFWYGIDPVRGEPLETWEQGVYGFGFVFGSGPLYRKGLKKVGGWWDGFWEWWNKGGKGKKPNGDWFPDRALPRDKNGVEIPDTDVPHTQGGQRGKGPKKYPQSREWRYDEDGNLIPYRDIDWGDHGYPDIHPNPHQHRTIPNPTGGTRKRGDPEPLDRIGVCR